MRGMSKLAETYKTMQRVWLFHEAQSQTPSSSMSARQMVILNQATKFTESVGVSLATKPFLEPFDYGIKQPVRFVA